MNKHSSATTSGCVAIPSEDSLSDTFVPHDQTEQAAHHHHEPCYGAAKKSPSSRATSSVVQGTMAAGLGVVMFSFSLPATAFTLTGFGPWTSTGLRGTVAALVAACCLAVTRAKVPSRTTWLSLAVVCCGCVWGFPLLTSLALTTSSTAHSAVVTGMLPLVTAVIASLRSHRHQPFYFWVASGVGALAAVGFALSQNHGAPTRGDMYLALAVLLCGAGYAEGGRLSTTMPGWHVIGWALVIGLPFMGIITAIAVSQETCTLSVKALIGLAYVSLISQFAGFVVWYRGMSLIGVPRASQLQLAQPLLALLWSVIILGETLPVAAPLVALLVLGCVVVTQRQGRITTPHRIRKTSRNMRRLGT